MDQLGCKRYCCRRMIMTHVDLIEKLLKCVHSTKPWIYSSYFLRRFCLVALSNSRFTGTRQTAAARRRLLLPTSERFHHLDSSLLPLRSPTSLEDCRVCGHERYSIPPEDCIYGCCDYCLFLLCGVQCDLAGRWERQEKAHWFSFVGLPWRLQQIHAASEVGTVDWVYGDERACNAWIGKDGSQQTRSTICLPLYIVPMTAHDTAEGAMAPGTQSCGHIHPSDVGCRGKLH